MSTFEDRCQEYEDGKREGLGYALDEAQSVVEKASALMASFDAIAESGEYTGIDDTAEIVHFRLMQGRAMVIFDLASDALRQIKEDLEGLPEPEKDDDEEEGD